MRSALLLLFAFLSFAASAQRVPPHPPLDDLELKSAYCLAVNREFAETFSRPDWAKGMADRLAELNSNIDRLESYLTDKQSHRHPEALSRAAKRAAADAALADSELSACMRRCEGQPKRGQCVGTCTRTSGAYARRAACETVDWLPY